MASGKKNGELPRATVEQVVEAATLPTKVVACHGVGLSVEVRSLTVSEQLSLGDMGEDEAMRPEFMRIVLSHALVDPKVTEEQAQSFIDAWPAGDVLAIFNAVMEVSGMADGFQEAEAR